MPSETNEDKIRKLEANSATLNERVDNLRLGQDQTKARLEATAQQFHELDKRLAVLEHALSHRWDVWKILLGAFVVFVLSIVGGLLSKSLDRWIERGPSSVSKPLEKNGMEDGRTDRSDVSIQPTDQLH